MGTRIIGFQMGRRISRVWDETKEKIQDLGCCSSAVNSNL